MERDRAKDMLRVVTDDVKKNYYDPKLRGLDWDAKVAQARHEIDTAPNFNMAMSDIAAALDALHDSHTFFMPPERSYKLDYGIQYQIVGDRCFVTQVRPSTDAEAKGLRPGDEILTINGYPVNRSDLWKIQYIFSVLRPQPGLRFALQDPSGAQRSADVFAKIRSGKEVVDLVGVGSANDVGDLIRDERDRERLLRARSVEYGDKLLIIKMPEFAFSEDEIESMVGKARKHDSLILDLRGNPGGSVETLRALVGGVFDKEIKIADRVGRKETKPEVAKPSRHPFTGKLVVLVDAKSASASELFSRIIQLEKRGTIIGDKTAGAVMEARHFGEKMGADTVFFYGVSVTEWDLVMSDGKSLEKIGVTPDEILMPTPKDLAAGRDPVLARAIEALGVTVTPEAAGKIFPFEWPKQ